MREKFENTSRIVGDEMIFLVNSYNKMSNKILILFRFINKLICRIFELKLELLWVIFVDELGLNILFIWPWIKVTTRSKKNDLLKTNINPKRDYYTGHLSGDVRSKINIENLNLTEKQLSHPLILDLNEKTRELNITNVTHSPIFKYKRLENVGIDPQDGRKVYLKGFNKTIYVNDNNEGKNVLKDLKTLVEKTEEKNPVVDMDELSERVDKRARIDGVRINNLKESKNGFLDKVEEVIKNTKD